ncbi:MAG: PQQ-binding-like beta-propeller repeat protein [Planctomycetes bacterium]|nr:PQQ-binding-like beta-propeller repeat protein [Planctomycetota bacterium]
MLKPHQIKTTLSIVIATLIAVSLPTFAQATKEVAGINLEQLENSGYRIDWINQPTTRGLHLPTLTETAFFTVDNADFVSKYDIDSGKWLWSTPVGNQTYKIKGISEMPNLKRTYVLSEGGVFVIESSTGNYPSNVDTKTSNNSQFFPLVSIANTGAVSFNDLMIYGSTNGNTVWFNPEIGFTASNYEVGSSVDITPTFVHGIRSKDGLLRKAIVSASTNGTVVAIDAVDVRQIWTIKLLDSVEAPVAFGTNSKIVDKEELPRTSVFIAGTDHYLRAVDLHSGRPRWKVLTESPLENSPFVVGDTVFQRIPAIGLASYKAFPNSFNGTQNWVASEVTGVPITTTKAGKLVCWDENVRQIQIVDTRKGGIVSTLPLPQAKSVIANSPSQGSLFLLNDSDIILRLDARR